MRRFFLLFSTIIIAITFSSCIDLVEEVTINKNLSGHYELRLEAEGLANMMNMGGQVSMPDMRKLDQKLNMLKHQKGIHNVQKKIKLENMKFFISFDFDNEKSLNNAIYTLAEVKPSIFIKKFLKVRKNKVVRPNLNPYLQKFIEEEDLMAQLPSSDLLNYVNYKLIVNTPTELRRAKGKKAIIQSNKKTVISSHSFKDIMLNDENLSLKVRM